MTINFYLSMGALGCTIALFISSLIQVFEIDPVPVAIVSLALFACAFIFLMPSKK